TRDIAKTLAVIVKPSKPEPYAGAIDAEACLNFLENQAEYYTAVRLPKEHWVQFTALQLTGTARSWRRNSGLTKDSPWDTFSVVFKRYFTPPDSANMARGALEKLQQNTSSVAAYTKQFNR
ncbi:hypothetical protein BGZ46_006637, partial [Entomortierella lignicola]